MHKTLNEVRLIGFVYGKARFNFFNNGSKVCNFLLKTYGYKQSATGAIESYYELHRCVAWGDKAPGMENEIKEKHMLYVSGSLRTSKFNDKNTGAQREVTEIVCDSIKLLCRPS